MRDPSRQEQRGIRLREIEWIELHVAEKITRMIERHQDHDQTTQQIDGLKPWPRQNGIGWCARVLNLACGLGMIGHGVVVSDQPDRDNAILASGREELNPKFAHDSFGSGAIARHFSKASWFDPAPLEMWEEVMTDCLRQKLR